MSDLPKGWSVEKMGIISERITKGATPTSYGFKYQDSGIRFVKVENIKNGKIDHASIRHYISGAANENQKRSILQYGDILFSIAGTIGVSCLVTRDDLPANTNQALAIIRGTKHTFNPKYLMFQLSSRLSRKEVEKQARGGGMNNISLRDVSEMIINIPPLNEQRRIVEKLEKLLYKVDDCKKRLEKIPAILKRFRQSVLAAACSGRLTADWREKNSDIEPASTLLNNIQTKRKTKAKQSVMSNSNELPDTWIMTKVNMIYEINPGHKDIEIDENSEVSFIPMTLIEEETGNINAQTLKKYREVKNGYTKFIEGDVIFAKITPCMENGKIAIAKNLKNGIGCGTTELHVFRPIVKSTNNYLFFYLLQRNIREMAKNTFQGTSGHLRVPVDFFYDIDFPLPPLHEQQEIVRRVEALFKKGDEIEARYKKAKAFVDRLTQSILAKAFRGELVPQDPNDEPASVLLGKIRAEKAKHETKGRERKKKGN